MSGPIPLNDQIVRGLKSLLFACFGRNEARYIHFKSWLVRRFADAGFYETAIFAELKRVKFQPGSVAVDVGANCGVYTKFFATLMGPGGQVYAFEPNPVYLSILGAIGGADQMARVCIYPEGVSDHAGTAYLETPTIGANVPEPALARIVDRSSSGAQKIRVVSLDEKLKDLKRLDLIKIDIEGGECAALRGAARLIQRFKPILIVEAHNRGEISRTLQILGISYVGSSPDAIASLEELPVSPSATYVLFPKA